MVNFGLNVIMLMGALFFFLNFFEDARRMLYGAILYITMPYTVFLMYDIKNTERMILWALLPWLCLFILLIVRAGRYKRINIARFVGIAGVAAVIIFVCVYYREYIGFVLFGNHEDTVSIVDYTIEEEGYYFGEYFTSFAYKYGRPGMGIGLFAALIIFIWYLFSEGKTVPRIYKALVLIALALIPFSMRYFPWDRVERINGFFYRAVRLMEYPNVILSKSMALFTVPAVYSLARFEDENRESVVCMIPKLSLGLSIFMALFLRFLF